jgi:hypothetical protein
MRYKITTRSGSRYIIDTEAKTWERTLPDDHCYINMVRTTNGTYTEIQGLKVGSHLQMIGPPYDKAFDARYIQTTTITALEEL